MIGSCSSSSSFIASSGEPFEVMTVLGAAINGLNANP